MRAHALRTVPEAELRVQLEALRRERWDAQRKAKDGSLQQPHRFGEARRQIARILTVLGERHD